MKKIGILALFAFLLASPIFADDDYRVAGLSLDFCRNSSEEIREVVSPFRLGIELGLNTFGEDRKIGFHWSGNFMYGNTDEEKTESSGFFFSTLLAPVFRFGTERILLLSAGISGGAGTGYWINKNELTGATKEKEEFFEAYAGFGGKATFIFGSGFTVGLNLAYYPLCFSDFSREEKSNESTVRNSDTLYKIGILVGFSL